MTITVRSYIFEKGGALKHVPRRVAEGLHAGEDALPDYAGTTQRVCEVIVENEVGKPVRIVSLRGRYWTFEADGTLNRDSYRYFFQRMHEPPRPAGKVLDIRPQLERKAFDEKNFWDLSPEDVDKVRAAVWPWTAQTPSEVRSVTGQAPKVPPMTDAGRRALSEILEAVHKISLSLEGLSEPALKGLAFEARRLATAYNEEIAIWDGIAAEVDRVREIRRRHRSGKGTWYAIIEVLHWDEERSQGRVLETLEERCESKAAAVQAARRLLAENAHRFEADVTLEPSVKTDLEHQPRSE